MRTRILSNLTEYKPDWLNNNCNKVLIAIKGLSLKEQLLVVEQTQDYLRQEEVEKF